MKPRTLVLVLAAALAAALAGPVTADAQSCTVKCGCASDGCGCQSGGGNGSNCDASGDGCFVKKCATAVTFAPDGAPLVVPQAGARPATWEKTARGVLVQRSCEGLVVARRYDRTAAAAARKRETVLVI